jgi:NADH-quinone oxidoreductase subunit F
MRVPAKIWQRVFVGVNFLATVNDSEEKWLKGEKTLGKKSRLIGGGNSAIDAARFRTPLGSDVTIL